MSETKTRTVEAALSEMVSASSHQAESISKRLVRRAEKRERKPIPVMKRFANSSRTSAGTGRRWSEILASVAVGILIAVIAFPAINYMKDQARQYFAQSKIQELNQKIDRFALLQPGVAQTVEAETPAGPLDLSNFGWEELRPNQIPLLVVNNDSSAPQLGIAASSTVVPPSDFLPPSIDRPANGLVLGQSRKDSFIGTSDAPLINASSFNMPVLPNFGQILPVAGGGPLQTAYGQNVLFHNGRIFIRRVPVVSPAK